MNITLFGIPLVRERERQVYLQLDELDSNTYNTYNINIIQYNTYNIVGIQVYLLLLITLTANCSVPMELMIYHSALFYFWSVDTCFHVSYHNVYTSLQVADGVVCVN